MRIFLCGFLKNENFFVRIFNIFFVRIFKKMRTFFKHWENTKEKICFCADFKNNDFFVRIFWLQYSKKLKK